MSPALLYLLKANVALLLFAAAYFGLLRRLTFFRLNRFILLFALVFSAAYPALPLPALFPAATSVPLVVVATEYAPVGSAAVPPTATPIDWEAMALWLYGAGAAVLLGRLLVQLLSLWRVRHASRPAVVQGQPVRVLTGAVSPFSFWQTIYLNPGQHPASELAAVLRHEQVHVRQWHTLDVLLAQVVQALGWCNPAAWLLRRALLDNLEYLADQAALQTGLDRQAYQYSLLRLSGGAAVPALVTHFTFPTLKNRVAMMNTPLSSPGQLARYFVAVPAVLAVALSFSAAQVQAQGAGPVLPAKAAATPVAKAPTAAAGADMPPAVRAYLDKHYPQAQLASWTSLQERNSVAPGFQYMAVIVDGGQRQQLYFDAAGQPAVVGIRKSQPQPAKPRSKATTVRLKPATPVQGSLAKPNGPPPVYYLDGQAAGPNINDINPKDIASISIFKGEQARQVAGEAGAGGVIVVTSKRNQENPEVRAFNEKFGVAVSASAPAAAPEQPKRVAYLAAPALAYITKTYPEARLLGVKELQATDGTPQYQAEIVIGRRPGYLVFDKQGNFISESYTAR
ncbi:MAG TPA: M56 family metallopeptidase [Hymenobacter sp.]|jgi:hypothetical protein|uniref:M56 family metallopeptidase n=1 Tax=Hymenobacter sp. TaxID=1898978 RepID=UPI002ED82F3E